MGVRLELRMEIRVKRQYFLPNCTIGTLEVIFQSVPLLPIYICDTLEPHAIDWNNEDKVKAKTAIPCGEYEVEFAFSKKFARNMAYLKNVPHFEGVMIHWGNLPKDTHGCILVGHNPRANTDAIAPKLINSRIKYDLLWKFLVQARKKNESITIKIEEDRR